MKFYLFKDVTKGSVKVQIDMIDTKLTKNLISDHDSNFDLGWLGAIVEWLEN